MIDIDKMILEAMSEKNASKRDAYKAIKAELMLIQTGSGGHKPRPVIDNDILIIAKKLIEIREESIKMYTEGLKDPNLDDENFRKREATLINYNDQVRYLKELLPPEVTKEQIQEAVMTAYPNGFDKKEMSTAIKSIKAIYPTADGKMVAEIVKQHIV